MPTPLTMTQAMTQIGTSGIKRVGSIVLEEFVLGLQGRPGMARYREMYLNDATVKRGMRAILWQLLKPDWRVEGAEGRDAEKAEEFLLSCVDDMSDTWRETLREMLTCLIYGASWCQMLYKQCLGPEQKDSKKRSKYNDGLTRWRKWSFRGQETWDGWEFDEGGDVSGLYQWDQYSAGTRVMVPLEWSLHFKIEGRLGDPNGESVLRSAYRPWTFKKEHEVFEAVRAERDATGVPVFQVVEGGPNLWDDNDPDAQALYTYLQKAGTAIRVDDQTSVIVPAGITFRLEGSPGAPQVDADKTIRRLDWQILGSMLAQFLELGQSAHGSFGKSESDQDLFLGAMEGILNHVIAETINRFEVPRLFLLNAGSFQLDTLPYFVPGELSIANIGELAEPLAKYVTAGLITPDPSLEAWLRQRGKLPERDENFAPPAPALPEAQTNAPPAGQEPTDQQPPGPGAVGKVRNWLTRRRRRAADEHQHGDSTHYTIADFLPDEEEG
jgi:hypothetical protein